MGQARRRFARGSAEAPLVLELGRGFSLASRHCFDAKGLLAGLGCGSVRRWAT